MLSVGIFADGTSNYGGYPVTGLLYGNVGQFVAQVIGAVVGFVWAFGASFVFFKILNRSRSCGSAPRSSSPASTSRRWAASATSPTTCRPSARDAPWRGWEGCPDRPDRRGAFDTAPRRETGGRSTSGSRRRPGCRLRPMTTSVARDTATRERAQELIRAFDSRAGSLGSLLGRVTPVDAVGVNGAGRRR